MLAAICCQKGDSAANLAAHGEVLWQARAQGCHLAVFPEMSLSGSARRHAARTGAWVAMATQAGTALDEDFPGLAALVTPAGNVAARLPDWRPGTLVVDIPVGRTRQGRVRADGTARPR